MSKSVWLSWLPAGEDAPNAQEDLGKLLKCGFNTNGSIWNRDLQKHGWTELAGQLSDPESCDVWAIAGRKEEFEDAGIRYGLSLAAIMIRELRGDKQPFIVVVGLDFKPEADALPTFLRSAKLLEGGSGNWAAKLLVQTHGKAPAAPSDPFRMNILAHEYFGQWFEVSPREGNWAGIMFGIHGEGAALQEHAVGPRGDLPEKTTLNYPTYGIKAEVGDAEFECCSVKNELAGDDAYWVQVKGQPSKLIFGANPDSEDMEVWVLELS